MGEMILGAVILIVGMVIGFLFGLILGWIASERETKRKQEEAKAAFLKAFNDESGKMMVVE